MKTLHGLALMLLFSLLVVACKKDHFVDIKVSGSEVTNVSSHGAAAIVKVSSNGIWEVESSEVWCKPDRMVGDGSADLVLDIEANLESKARTGVVRINCDGISKVITISQQATDGKEHSYKLPIVYHILYADPSDEKQNVRKGYMAGITAEVNKFFNDKVNGGEMNLEFVMATKNPEGVALEEPGVNRIAWDGEYPIDCKKVMAEETEQQYKDILWDPNRYINVLIYKFPKELATAGMGQFPLTVKGNYLPGTKVTDHSYLTSENVSFVFCVSLNSDYIYDRSTPDKWKDSDFVRTVTHELSHLLGLLHAFDASDSVNDCSDTDFCEDTPSYNRNAYSTWLMDYTRNNPEPKMEEMLKRTDCSGTVFQSRNVMDYFVTLADRFTADQRKRVRFVLTYSPLIPGGKIRKEGVKATKTLMPEIRTIAME